MRILVVEDEHKIAASIKKGLMAENFSVDVVHDADSGLSYGMSPEYDAIVLDWLLPGTIDGQGVCRELRAGGVKTPILMLTALGSTDRKVSGLNSGADDYLAKPFAFDELVARLHALLRRPRDLHKQAIEAGGISLDPIAKTVVKDGVEIDLTAKRLPATPTPLSTA